MKKIKALGYIRVSTTRQKNEGISLEGQEKQIIGYCKQNNIELIKIYKDEGISGNDIDKRNDFKIMIDFALNNNINTIISFKLSRFTRNARDLINTMHILEKEDINLIFIEDGINTSTNMGKSMGYMAGIFAEMESENTSDFVSMTMPHNALKGNWNGGIVFGYDSDNNKQLKINEAEKEIVEEIFHYFSKNNWGFKKIANHLNHRNLKTDTRYKKNSWKKF